MHETRTPVIYRIDLKAIAILLFCLCMLLSLLSTGMITLMAEYGFYEQSYDLTRENIFTSLAENTVYHAERTLWGTALEGATADANNPPDAQEVAAVLKKQDRNISYALLRQLSRENILLAVYDSDGKCIVSTVDGRVAQYAGEYTFEYFPENNGVPATTRTIRYLIPRNMRNAGLLHTIDPWIFRLYTIRFWLIGVAVLSLLTTVLLLILLFCAVGHSPGTSLIQPNTFDHLPTDLVLAFYGGLAYFEFLFFRNFLQYSIPASNIVLGVLIILADIPLLLLLLLSLANRSKCSLLVKNSILYALLLWIWKIILVPIGHAVSAIAYFLRHTFRNIPLVWKSALIYIFLSLLEGGAILLWGKDFNFLVIFWVIEKAVLLPLILAFVIGLRRLQKGGQALAEGNLQYRVEEDYLPGNLLQHARNLNSISGGMGKVIEERMKSERFRTELITNVSHDLKTPLTSIINYVDLLKKEPCSTKAAEGYLSVLDRQSARLKKLVEDLVEASKASTGNVTVHPAPCELDTMLEQALGEYEERMHRVELDPVLHTPEDSTLIFTDGRLLWRVIDNLLNNILKYAMPGTRVYFDLSIDGDNTVTTFRNISVVPLNIPPEELMERFVRGDSSRHTEGSGLGLSIAKSLTELMGGKMVLSIDGDLFKVSLIFPRYHIPEETPAEETVSEENSSTDAEQ